MQFMTFDFGNRAGLGFGAGTYEPENITIKQITVGRKGTPVRLETTKTPLSAGIWFFPVETGSKKIFIGNTVRKPTETTGLCFPANTNFFVEFSDASECWVDASDNSTTVSCMYV